MKIQDLQNQLDFYKVPKDAYSLRGGLPNEAFCIDFRDGQWEVYYSERGSKTGLVSFKMEEEACAYFFEWIIDTLKRMRILE